MTFIGLSITVPASFVSKKRIDIMEKTDFTIETKFGKCDFHYFSYKDYLCLVKHMHPDFPEWMAFNQWYCGYVAVPDGQLNKEVLELLKYIPGGLTFDEEIKMEGDCQDRHWFGFDTMHHGMDNYSLEKTKNEIQFIIECILVILKQEPT